MTNDTIRIRRAMEEDADILAGHRVAMFRDMESTTDAIEAPLHAQATGQIREAMAAGEYVAWLAYDGDNARIIGGAGVQLRRLFPRPQLGGREILQGREGIVLNVYVDRDYRRRGVARRLMQEILNWVPQTDIVQLVLHASDEGRPLYESMGFVPTNEMRYRGELHRR